MSSDHRIYVGPYARCKNPEVKTTRRARTCPKLDCTEHNLRHKDGAYCSTCGTRIRECEVETTAFKVSWSEVSEDFQDASDEYSDEGTLKAFGWNSREQFKTFEAWIPTGASWCGRVVRFENFVGEQRLGTTTPESDKEQFADEFAAELVVLRERYGEHAVEVQWGVLGDYC